MSTLSSPSNLPRILLVEDSETCAAIATRCLRDQYQVVWVRDGQCAWEALVRDAGIELVLTDVQMPRLNGHELLCRLRASGEPRLAGLPVIVMTATNHDADRERAFASGASDFVAKPLNPLELQARVRVHQRLAQTIRELEASRQLLEEQATTDPLTRLKNRRAFADAGRRHFSLARRHGYYLSLVMLDLDHFKEINDTYGHPVGDRVLVDVAQTLARSVRGSDTPARLGGEEFAILLPNTGQQGAAMLAERVCRALERCSCRVAGAALAVTASAGVACYDVDPAEDLEQLLELADRRLYLAKQSGRNRVVAAS